MLRTVERRCHIAACLLYLDQLWQEQLKLSICNLLKVVNCSSPYCLIMKTEEGNNTDFTFVDFTVTERVGIWPHPQNSAPIWHRLSV